MHWRKVRALKIHLSHEDLKENYAKFKYYTGILYRNIIQECGSL